MMSRTLSYILAFALLLCSGPLASAQTKKSSPKKPASSASAKKSAAKKSASKPAPKPAAKPYNEFEDSGVPKVRAASAIVIDANSGRVLHEVNANEMRPVASTQKLLTALLIAEAGNLDRPVRVEASDTWAEPTKLYIKAGDVYTRYQFLQILLVKSMNDVARALARDNAGSVEAFAAKMNRRAQELGMSSSYFVNPNGLPAPGQFSTARDMAKVAFVAYRNRTIRSMVNMKSLSFRYANGQVKQFSNTNRVLKNSDFCNGMKTGYTNASGFCLIASGAMDGRDVITVVLGCKKDEIWTDSHRLLAWGLQPQGAQASVATAP